MYLAAAILFVSLTTIQACPDCQTTVHIQNYDGPIIVHSTCDNQHRHLSNHGNPGNQYKKCDNDCTCVTKHNYYPTTQGYLTTNYGYGNQYCKMDGYGLDGYGCCSKCGTQIGNSCPYQCPGYYSC